MLTAPASNTACMLFADVRGMLMCREFLAGGGKPLASPDLGMSLRQSVVMIIMMMMLVVVVVAVVVSSSSYAVIRLHENKQ
jgi:hypothetical protein